MRALPALAAVLVLACILLEPARAAPTEQQQQAQARLEAVRAEIDKLTQAQHVAAAEKEAINRKLLQQARAVDEAAAALREDNHKLAELESELARLQQQRQAVAARLATQQDALAELLRATYKLGQGSELRMLLGHVARCPPQSMDAGCASGEHMLSRLQRALAYSHYFQQDRSRKIRALLTDLDEQRKLEDEVALQTQLVRTQRDLNRERHDSLVEARQKQQQLLARAKADMDKRGARIGSLQQQRESLEDLLEKLRDVFADIPVALPDEQPFGKRRGELPWPLSGPASEYKEGILIATSAGSKVRAVAHGRVAFADWIRGYGMLVIIDHGDGWMSLYGDNESLLRRVGDWVNTGDVIATSGLDATGTSGLFFALRHDGEPVAPLRWLGKPPASSD